MLNDNEVFSNSLLASFNDKDALSKSLNRFESLVAASLKEFKVFSASFKDSEIFEKSFFCLT